MICDETMMEMAKGWDRYTREEGRERRDEKRGVKEWVKEPCRKEYALVGIDSGE